MEEDWRIGRIGGGLEGSEDWRGLEDWLDWTAKFENVQAQSGSVTGLAEGNVQRESSNLDW